MKFVSCKFWATVVYAFVRSWVSSEIVFVECFPCGSGFIVSDAYNFKKVCNWFDGCLGTEFEFILDSCSVYD